MKTPSTHEIICNTTHIITLPHCCFSPAGLIKSSLGFWKRLLEDASWEVPGHEAQLHLYLSRHLHQCRALRPYYKYSYLAYPWGSSSSPVPSCMNPLRAASQKLYSGPWAAGMMKRSPDSWMQRKEPGLGR